MSVSADQWTCKFPSVYAAVILQLMETKDPMCARTRVSSVAVAFTTCIASVGGTGGTIHKEIK